MAGRRRAGRGAPRAPGTPARPAAPAPLRLWPRVAAVVLVLLVGGAGALAVADDARRDATQREELLAPQTGNLAAATVQQLVAAISGVSGLPDASGVVDREAFATYALGRSTSPRSSRWPTCRSWPPPSSASFEASVGRPITDRPGGAPAPARDTYLPVQWIRPVNPTPEVLVGFDLAIDEVRRAAIEEPATRAPPSSAARCRHSRAGARGLRRPRRLPGRHAGRAPWPSGGPRWWGTSPPGCWASSCSTPSPPRSTTRRHPRRGRPDRRPATDDDAIGPCSRRSCARGRGGRRAHRPAGATWRITVDDGPGRLAPAPWWVLAATLALAGTLGVLAWRAERHQRQVVRHVGTGRSAGRPRSLAGRHGVGRRRGAGRAHAVPPALAGGRGPVACRPRGPPPPTAVRRRRRRRAPGTRHRRTAGQRRRPGHRVIVRRRIPDVSGATAGTLEVTWPSGEARSTTSRSPAWPPWARCAARPSAGPACSTGRGRDAVTSRLLAGLAEAAATAGTADAGGPHAGRPGRQRCPGPRPPDRAAQRRRPRRCRWSTRASALGGLARATSRGLDHPWPMVDAFRRNDDRARSATSTTSAVRYPGIVDGLRSAGLEAAASVPLVGADGVPFGAVTLSWSSPQRFDARLTDDAADDRRPVRVEPRAGQGHRPRAGRARRHWPRWRPTCRRPAASTRSAAAIVDHATRALDRRLRPGRRGRGPPPAPARPRGAAPRRARARTVETDLDGDFPALRAVRERRLVTFPSLDDIAAADPHVADDLGGLGLRAAACAPLVDSRRRASRRVRGAVGHAPALRRGAVGPASATVADLCAQSDRAVPPVRRRAPRAPRPAAHACCPRRPTCRGSTSPPATSRRPGRSAWVATGTTPSPSSGRRMCLVVGDVSGHGVEAVATMTQIRTVVHTLVVGGMTLPDDPRAHVRDDAARRPGLRHRAAGGRRPRRRARSTT